MEEEKPNAKDFSPITFTFPTTVRPVREDSVYAQIETGCERVQRRSRIRTLPEIDKELAERNVKRRAQRRASLSDLSHDLTINILSRLPVKQLLRSKSVCHTWLNLISTSNFAKLHLLQSFDGNCGDDEKLILVDQTLYFVDHEVPHSLARALQDRMGPEFPHTWLKVLGSCHGLLCVMTDSALLLWNPSTTEFKKVPGSPIEHPTYSRKHSPPFYGLGYDSFYDDYKLVRVITFPTKSYQTEVKVYSLRTNSWKKIEGFPFHVPKRCNGVFVAKSMHWLVMSLDDLGNTFSVAYLNLTEEKYGLLKLPKCNNNYSKKTDFEIGVLCGGLCAYRHIDSVHFELWVMKEYSLVESWTRFVINTSFITGCMSFRHLKPVCVLNSGRIILKIGQKGLVLYDIKRKSCRHLMFRGMPKQFDAVSYRESLVSPNAVNTDEEEK